MRKSMYFASRPSEGGPDPKELERYFLAPPGQRWFFETRNDSGGLTAEGVDGTEHLEAEKGRIDVELDMWGNPDLGVCSSSIPSGAAGSRRCTVRREI